MYVKILQRKITKYLKRVYFGEWFKAVATQIKMQNQKHLIAEAVVLAV